MRSLGTALVFWLILSSCQSYSEDSLGTDMNLLVKCPANGCANHAPDVNELKVEWPPGGTVASFSTDPTVQIGGECYASTFPDNRLEVIVYNASKQATGATVRSLDDTVPRCVQGRFNLVIDAAPLPVNARYTVRIEIVGYDGAGKSYRGGQNWTEIAINRAQ